MFSLQRVNCPSSFSPNPRKEKPGGTPGAPAREVSGLLSPLPRILHLSSLPYFSVLFPCADKVINAILS
jgi:hypothetical protein